MGACAERDDRAWPSARPRGRFLARVTGQTQGNVLLRRKQYRVADDPSQSCRLARMMIFGKVSTTPAGAWSAPAGIMRCASTGSGFAAVSAGLQGHAARHLRRRRPHRIGCAGLEGSAAVAYFSVLDEMILARQRTHSSSRERSRRPPLDAFNALLSFAYSLLAHDCASALESCGTGRLCGLPASGSAWDASLWRST